MQLWLQYHNILLSIIDSGVTDTIYLISFPGSHEIYGYQNISQQDSWWSILRLFLKEKCAVW